MDFLLIWVAFRYKIGSVHDCVACINSCFHLQYLVTSLLSCLSFTFYTFSTPWWSRFSAYYSGGPVDIPNPASYAQNRFVLSYCSPIIYLSLAPLTPSDEAPIPIIHMLTMDASRLPPRALFNFTTLTHSCLKISFPPQHMLTVVANRMSWQNCMGNLLVKTACPTSKRLLSTVRLTINLENSWYHVHVAIYPQVRVGVGTFNRTKIFLPLGKMILYSKIVQEWEIRDQIFVKYLPVRCKITLR